MMNVFDSISTSNPINLSEYTDINKNDILSIKEIICNKIENLESKMDIILSSINSLVKYNFKLEEQLNIVKQKLDNNNTILNKKDKEIIMKEKQDVKFDLTTLVDNNSNNDNINVKLDNNENKILSEPLVNENKRESKMSNYKAFLSGNTKLNKSPGRAKNKSTERLRPTANSTLQLVKKEKEMKDNEEEDNKIKKYEKIENNIEKEKKEDKEDKEDKEEKDKKDKKDKEEKHKKDKEEKDKKDKEEIKKKKVLKNIDNYKEIKKEQYDIDINFIKKCLNDGCIESDIKIFKKIYIDNVPKEFYPIRNIRRKLQYWLNGHMNEDYGGNYIKDTIINNIENCYISVNKYDDSQNNIDQFIRNQEYITRMTEQKYKERFLSMIIDSIKI
jgi:hypothetical protein